MRLQKSSENSALPSVRSSPNCWLECLDFKQLEHGVLRVQLNCCSFRSAWLIGVVDWDQAVICMARVSGRLVVTDGKEKDDPMFVAFSDDLISPHQLRKGGYYKGQKTFEAMIQVLSQVSKSENMTPSTDHKMIRTESPKSSRKSELAAKPFGDRMNDNVVAFDSFGPDPLLRLLENIHQFVVRIDEVAFECSAYPFVLKSSFFRDYIQSFTNSSRKSYSVPDIPLELPGGRHTFELIRIFCYDSRVAITKENILNLLAASTSLGFTEDIAPENLLSQCERFIAEASIMSIMSILNHSREEDNSHLLIAKLAQHALAFENSHDPAPTREIVELISELGFLPPRIVDAALREFRHQGVHLVTFFWCTELPTNLDVLLCSSDERNGRSIFTYFSEALDERIAAGEVHLEELDPEKLVMVLNPGVMTRPMKSGDTIQEYLASKLPEMNINLVKDLDPRAVTDLVSRAVIAIPHEMRHLAEMVDRALVLDAEKSPWDGASRDAIHRFMEMAECGVERESHDMLYDAVERFAQLCTHEDAADVWDMIDVEKLSETKFEAAVAFFLENRDHYYVRLLRRRQENRLASKRKLSISIPVEEGEARRKSRRKVLFSVFVRALDGSLYSLEVEPGATVGNVRDAIGKRQSRLERFWWPVYRGQKLLMSHTVASYGIEKDCTLNMKVFLVDEPEREVCPSTSEAMDFFEMHAPCVCGCK